MTLLNLKHLLDDTKYTKTYFRIIESAYNENRVKLHKNNPDYNYYEAHHILPVSIFPEYKNFKTNQWNKILLSAREHYICHLLLMKHYKKVGTPLEFNKMSKAVKILSKKGTYNSKNYECFKLNLSCSKEAKEKISIANKGNVIRQKQRLAISIANKGRKHTVEAIEKIRESSLNRKHTDISKKKLSMKLSNKPKSESHRKSLSENWNHNVKRNSKEIGIFDTEGNMVFKSTRGLKKFCEDNKLPFNAFFVSYSNNGEPIYSNLTNSHISRFTKNGMIKYKGWYAKLL